MPARPDPGLGYIQPGESVDGAKRVARFVEKPDRATAERMVGEYLELFSQLIFEPLKERPLKEFGDGGASTDVWSPSPSRRRGPDRSPSCGAPPRASR